MRRVNRDNGAATVIVAVMLVVLVGMVAFAIDAAALYQERAELQNGADAAALAIAENCAEGLIGEALVECATSTATGMADDYADLNARDGAAAVDSVALDLTGQTVDVITSTVDSESGATILAPFFAQVLGYEGSTVRASASAAWGFPSSGLFPPLIISECEWFDPLRPPLEEGPPFTSESWTFTFHDGNHGGTCDHSNSGFDLPGGFGWLTTGGGDCGILLATGDWKNADTGSSPSNGCTPSVLKDMLLNETVILPYYDDKTGQGSNTQYHVSGFGGFYVTGYNFGGQYKEPAGDVPCRGDQRCIRGHFTYATIYDGDFGGPDRGVVLVKLTG